MFFAQVLDEGSRRWRRHPFGWATEMTYLRLRLEKRFGGAVTSGPSPLCVNLGEHPGPAHEALDGAVPGGRTRAGPLVPRICRFPRTVSRRHRIPQPLPPRRRRRRRPGRCAPRAAPTQPGQRPHIGALDQRRTRRLHHRHPVAVGQPQPHRNQRRRPAQRPRLGLPLPPPAHRPASHPSGRRRRRLHPATPARSAPVGGPSPAASTTTNSSSWPT
jgi:hypothetical protein